MCLYRIVDVTFAKTFCGGLRGFGPTLRDGCLSRLPTLAGYRAAAYNSAGSCFGVADEAVSARRLRPFAMDFEAKTTRHLFGGLDTHLGTLDRTRGCNL